MLYVSLLSSALVVADFVRNDFIRHARAELSPPATGGFSVKGLGRLAVAMQGAVDRGAVDGIVTLLFRHGVVVHPGKYGWQDKDNNPALRENGYWLVNGSLFFQDRNGRYKVSAWAKNVANEKHFVSGLSSAGLGFMEIFPGLPRTFGITVTGRF